MSKNGSESAKAIRKRLRSSQEADFFVLGDRVLDELKNTGKLYSYKNTQVAITTDKALPIHKMLTGYTLEIGSSLSRKCFIFRHHHNGAPLFHHLNNANQQFKNRLWQLNRL